MSPIKEELYRLCLRQIDERIDGARQAMEFAQASANDETKSSAGDKYETGRAMAQLEIEKINTQLAEAKKIKLTLLQLDLSDYANTIQAGNLVITSQGNFFISIPVGQFTVHDQTYYAISTSSPIAKLLLGLKTGDRFSFNKKEYVINNVF